MQKLSVLMKKTIYILPFLFMTSLSEIFLYTPREQPMSEVLWYSIFGKVSGGGVRTMVFTVKSLGFLFLFAILYGGYISGFFRSVSMILFTRIRSRARWGIQKIGMLCALASVYTVLLLLFEFTVGMRQVTEWTFDRNVMLTLISLFGMIFPLLTTICVMVNWVSIKHGIPIGICMVLLAVVALQMIAVSFFDNHFNMVLNPLCFNSILLTISGLMFMKILMSLLYMAAVSGGLLVYIEHMDIF